MSIPLAIQKRIYLYFENLYDEKLVIFTLLSKFLKILFRFLINLFFSIKQNSFNNYISFHYIIIIQFFIQNINKN